MSHLRVVHGTRFAVTLAVAGLALAGGRVGATGNTPFVIGDQIAGPLPPVQLTRGWAIQQLIPSPDRQWIACLELEQSLTDPEKPPTTRVHVLTAGGRQPETLLVQEGLVDTYRLRPAWSDDSQYLAIGWPEKVTFKTATKLERDAGTGRLMVTEVQSDEQDIYRLFVFDRRNWKPQPLPDDRAVSEFAWRPGQSRLAVLLEDTDLVLGPMPTAAERRTIALWSPSEHRLSPIHSGFGPLVWLDGGNMLQYYALTDLPGLTKSGMPPVKAAFTRLDTRNGSSTEVSRAEALSAAAPPAVDSSDKFVAEHDPKTPARLLVHPLTDRAKTYVVADGTPGQTATPTAWSPDGTLLLFAKSRDLRDEVRNEGKGQAYDLSLFNAAHPQDHSTVPVVIGLSGACAWLTDRKIAFVRDGDLFTVDIMTRDPMSQRKRSSDSRLPKTRRSNWHYRAFAKSALPA